MTAGAATVAALTLSGSCRSNGEPGTNGSSSAVLRVGVAQLSATNAIAGLRQLSQIISVEALARLGEDGRVEPLLAESWAPTDERRTLRVSLRRGVKFHDGSPLNPGVVAAILPDALRTTYGPIVEDVDHVKPAGADSVEIGFRRRSPFLLESLEVPIRKPGPSLIGTGPFMLAANSPTQLRANADYYLGAPRLAEIRIQTFPAVRTAWAELLRNGLDMLYEVGPDALDSLGSSTSVSVFTFTRRYQFMIALNTQAPALRSRDVRKALSIAVDRTRLVQQALNGHGVPSSGPIWPRYWALQNGLPSFQYDPRRAAEILYATRPTTKPGVSGVRFTCLVPSDAIYERIALELKRQFEAVGVDMDVRAASHDEIFEAEKNHTFDAVLIEAVSGPTLLRSYLLWHSKGAGNPGSFGDSTVDRAFDRVRDAETDTDYLQAVAGVQQAFMDDPPAIFLAWRQLARAVSKRFVVPAAEPGRDILSNLRLWKPVADERRASRN